MCWIDIASIIFVCVTMNHLGLVSKIEEVTGISLPVINCPKCGSFWFTLGFMFCEHKEYQASVPFMLAISFLASYAAIWLELTEGFIDKLYIKLYDKIYPTADTAYSDSLGTTDTVSGVPEQ